MPISPATSDTLPTMPRNTRTRCRSSFSFGPTVRIFDARKRMVRLQDLYSVNRQIKQNQIQRIALGKWKKDNKFRASKGWIALLHFATVAVVSSVLYCYFAPTGGRSVVHYGSVIVAMIPALVAWRLLIQQTCRWIGSGMIGIGWSAACGYCLSGLVVETDGCTVCPECGAAWRLPGDLRSEESQSAQDARARGPKVLPKS